MKKTTRSKSKSTSVDFSGVESGGFAVADGRYLAYPQSVEKTEAESGNEMFKFKWKIVGPKSKGAVVFDNAVLVPQSLWRLKTILEMLGFEVPDGEMDIDEKDLEGEEHTVGIEITNEKYKGKDQPRITGFFNASELEEGESEEKDDDDKDDDAEDEKPSKPKKKGAKKAEDDDNDDDDDDDDDKEDEKPADKKLGKTKVKVGSKVTFEDEKGKTIRATVTEIEGKDAKVEEKDGTEWEISVEDLELA